MTSAAHYRALAAQLRAKASHENVPAFRAEWERLALCYVRLAEQADINGTADIVYEAVGRREVLIAVARPKTIGGL